MATELLPREPGKRKTALVTIDADNRDRGKRFLLTEMPAFAFEKWFLDVVAKLAREGTQGNMRGLDATAIMSLPLSWVDDQRLMAQLLSCVQTWEDGAPIARHRVESDTEEWTTVTHLRMEVLSLHVGFSVAATLWSFLPPLLAALGVTTESSSPAPTSPEPSPSS